MTGHVLTLSTGTGELHLTVASCSCGHWRMTYSRTALERSVLLDLPGVEHAEHVKAADPRPDSGTMLSPDCRDAKHTACNGNGYDLARDQFAPCPCPCHVRPR